MATRSGSSRRVSACASMFVYGFRHEYWYLMRSSPHLPLPPPPPFWISGRIFFRSFYPSLRQPHVTLPVAALGFGAGALLSAARRRGEDGVVPVDVRAREGARRRPGEEPPPPPFPFPFPAGVAQRRWAARQRQVRRLQVGAAATWPREDGALLSRLPGVSSRRPLVVGREEGRARVRLAAAADPSRLSAHGESLALFPPKAPSGPAAPRGLTKAPPEGRGEKAACGWDPARGREEDARVTGWLAG